MGIVSKTDFRKPYRRNREKYPLPEYGEGAYVVLVALTSRDIVALQEAYGASPDTGNMDFVHELLYRTLADDDGQPLFAGPADVAKHLNFSLVALEDVCAAALRVSGIEAKRDPEKN